MIGLIASSPDLDRVLDGVVEALTKATACHACFVYLRSGDRLRMRAASRVYAQLVGEVEFGVEEGLAGWAVRRNTLAFIRENALEDPRTNHVLALEEERFQSMVAVPISSRTGAVMGVIVLHTIAPHEFDGKTLDLLAHAAPLVAGAIENAQLYADARRRVAALTALSNLSQEIAAIQTSEELYLVGARGVRSLLHCRQTRLYNLNEDRRLVLVAADPPTDELRPLGVSGSVILLELVQQREPDETAGSRVRQALGLDPDSGHALVVPIAAGEEHLGALVAVNETPLPQGAEELMRAVANQVAVAAKKAELIERLTEETFLRDLFRALESGDSAAAQALARKVGCDLGEAHVFVQIEREESARGASAWPRLAERADVGLRRHVPGVVCEAGSERLRALMPLLGGSGEAALEWLDERLGELGAALGVRIGRSGVRHGAGQARDGLREAADAARVAAATLDSGGVLAYGSLGAYRYLVQLVARDAPPDPYLEAVRKIADYDRRRRSQLVTTLEEYLLHRRRINETARTLVVHPNTLRQRLERIETLTGLDLNRADLLALEMAIKLARLKAPSL
ncbi:MAG: helix-turn-helix domain-containing protein [Solirubrobacteraceae bacterium]